MLSRKLLLAASLGGMAFGAWGWNAVAQDRPQFDPAQFQQRMMERYKETLKVSDEEWKALQPKVEKVMAAQRDARSGGGGFFGGGGGGPGGRRGGGAPGGAQPGGRGDGRPETAVSKARSELRTTVEDEKATKDDVEKKLVAYRDARDKAKEEVVKAQKDLKELLTRRQEATLVLEGVLD